MQGVQISFQWCLVTGQEAVVINRNKGGSVWTPESTSALCMCLSTGTSIPERWWNLSSLWQSDATWTWAWAALLCVTWLKQGELYQLDPGVPPSLNHNVDLRGVVIGNAFCPKIALRGFGVKLSTSAQFLILHFVLWLFSYFSACATEVFWILTQPHLCCIYNLLPWMKVIKL